MKTEPRKWVVEISTETHMSLIRYALYRCISVDEAAEEILSCRPVQRKGIR